MGLRLPDISNNVGAVKLFLSATNTCDFLLGLDAHDKVADPLRLVVSAR